MSTTAEEQVTSLLAFIAGRGFPADLSFSEAEVEIVSRIRELPSPEKKNVDDLKQSLQGTWRLVFTTNDQLKILSSIPGGPTKLYFEHISDDTLHVAVPFKGLFLLILGPVLLVVCLIFAVLYNLTFLSAFFVTYLAYSSLAKFGPSGVLVSRRVGLHFSENMEVTSQLERDVLGLFNSQFGFDKNSIDPMKSFCKTFDLSDGTKDRLKVGFLLGWRIVPKPLSIHLLTHETVRKEEVLFVNKHCRITQATEKLAQGDVKSFLSIYIRDS